MFRFIWIVLAWGLSILPAVTAYNQDHPNGTPIFIINLLLGWTVLGWILSLAWALSNRQTAGTHRVQAGRPRRPLQKGARRPAQDAGDIGETG